MTKKCLYYELLYKTNWHLKCTKCTMCTKHGVIYFEFFLKSISVINQLSAQNFCFTISLFHASTCFEHMCSKHVEA